MNDYALALTDDDTFSQAEIDFVTNNFVCAVCHADLNVIYIPGNRRVLIVCVEHGNVCDCGRVTRATVSMEIENGFRRYHEVIRHLSDLWGHLADRGIDRNKASMITKHYVCAVCGGNLLMYSRKDDPKMNSVDIRCERHGSINDCGQIEKEKFTYNFQRIRDWEKSHKGAQQ